MLVRPIGMKPAARSRATARRIVLGRRRIPQRDRAGRGHVACDVEQVLDRDRDAGERRSRRATRADAVVKIRRRERVLRMDLEKNAPAFSRLIRDPR